MGRRAGTGEGWRGGGGAKEGGGGGKDVRSTGTVTNHKHQTPNSDPSEAVFADVMVGAAAEGKQRGKNRPTGHSITDTAEIIVR